ncbi:MAG: TIGR00730 family Rossman fold protein [Burkholderiaceae bacterium]|nr:TIGR00730 family Rossman fold protein [Burkholderiaceae bacterium]
MTEVPSTPANRPAFSLCVYLGSKPGTDPRFVDAASQVGRWIGQHRGQLVYGGGNNGLMGVVADATLAAGGTVVGIIPESLVIKEFAKHDCTELHVVQTMHERKQMMAERADAFLALPGGIGTFEELFEVWTWRQLGYHDKPIGVLNVAGYYDTLNTFLAQSVKAGFMGAWQMDLIQTASDLNTLLPQLVQAAGFAAPDQLDRI